MDLKELTPNDTDWVKALVDIIYDDLPIEQIKSEISNPDVITIGDENIPIYLRLVSLKIDPETAKALPIQIGEGQCTEVADLHTTSNDYDGVVIPTLATGLAKALAQFPNSATRPVWAYLDPDTADFLQQKYFPNCWVEGNYLGHKTLQEAYDEVKAYG